jgi:hypothetical protein
LAVLFFVDHIIKISTIPKNTTKTVTSQTQIQEHLISQTRSTPHTAMIHHHGNCNPIAPALVHLSRWRIRSETKVFFAVDHPRRELG